jgi:hypothetical protein
MSRVARQIVHADTLHGVLGFWVDALRPLLLSYSLFGDPVVYVTRTMDEGDAFCLTSCEEANDIQADYTDFVQVERDVRPSGLYLRFQF